ncbi:MULTISPECIES: succinyl-diaminopimelate desuccinylase [Rhodomicrobium]|uniref:succinyl-diaminopimelate desuccinylase n=1 Tax=Rhodomicrobium TaxID=1068 RepID=UPI000B4B02B3|nr:MULTISPECIES: succinyl-diaminopimelate desuccinylase [Rhodomicrobium]
MTDDLDPIAHAQALIRCPSVTPEQAGALDYMEARLGAAGFACRRLRFGGGGTPEIDNLYARIGEGSPHLCFAGHIDVVPPGDEASWTAAPFGAEIRGGVLYGRGAVDMKGAVAAMMAAALRYLGERGGHPNGTISFLMTADEEGPATHGTRAVIEWMRGAGERPDHCLLGEPTHPDRMGEAIKIGRRGSLSGRLSVRGVQGHVAYPQRTRNPVTGLVAAMQRIIGEKLDGGSENFAPSNLEVTSIDTGNPAVNVVPAKVSAQFNIRFNDLHSAASLSERLRELVAETLAGRGLEHELSFESNADAFLTRPGGWVDMLAEVSREVTGVMPVLSTDGGTSDARFIKDICPVVEYGLVNETIHKVDERTPVADLEMLTEIYRRFLARYFAQGQ